MVHDGVITTLRMTVRFINQGVTTLGEKGWKTEI